MHKILNKYYGIKKYQVSSVYTITFLKSSLFLNISLKSVAFKFSNNLCMKMAGS